MNVCNDTSVRQSAGGKMRGILRIQPYNREWENATAYSTAYEFTRITPGTGGSCSEMLGHGICDNLHHFHCKSTRSNFLYYLKVVC